MALGSLGTLSVNIQVNLQRFLTQLQETEDRLKKTGTKFKQIGKSMSKFITVPLNLVGGMAIKTGMDFEKGMSKVRANLGLTVEQMEILENKAREIGKTTKFSATEAAEAMNYMALAGWDTNQILDSLKATLDLSVASGEDLASVTDIVTDAMTAFKLKSDEAGRFVDVLATTSSSANTNIKMLGEAFSYAAPIAGTLGATVEDSALALGLMANQSIKSSMAGTALRSILTNLSAPTEKVKETLNKLGIEISKTKDGSFDFGNTMLSLRSAFSELTKEQKTSAAQTIAGKFAMSGLLAVVDATQEDFDKLSGKIEKSSGRAEEMAKIVGDNLSGKFAQMKSAIEEVSLIIAERLMPVVEILTKVITTLANKFGNLSPTLQTTIIVIGAVVAAIGPLLVAIGGIIAILPTLVTAFATITGPIGLTIAAVMGLAAAGIVLYKNWDVVKIKMLKIVLSLANMFRKIFNSIYKFIFNKIDDILEKIAFFGKMLGKIFPDLEAKIGTLRSKFKDMDRNFTTANIVAELEIAKRQQQLSAELENLRKEKIEETAVATENLTSATGNNTEAIGDNTEAISDNTDELESNAVGVEDLRNKTIDAYEDIGTGVIDALRSMHDKKLEIEQKSINRTLSMVSRESRMKISEYNKVFVAKIRTLDAETAESLKAVQKQINSINNLTNAEEKELEEQEFLKEKSERLKRIEEEDSAEKKKELQEKLNDFILKRERQLILNRRQSVIEGLQDEMDKIREQAVSKKEELQKEYDAQKKNEEEIEARKKGHLEALLQQIKTHHEENTKEENLFAEARKLIIDGNQADIINLIKSYNTQWKDAGKSLGEKLLEGLSSVESRIRSKIASLTSLRGISSVTGMNIPAYATGTNYVPNDGLAYLHKGEAVIPASQNKAGMNGITVNVTGNTISNSRDADKLANTIVSKLRMAGVNP